MSPGFEIRSGKRSTWSGGGDSDGAFLSLPNATAAPFSLPAFKSRAGQGSCYYFLYCTDFVLKQ